MKHSTRRAKRQSYVWARFFILEFAPLKEKMKRRIIPSGSATQGFGSAVRWRS